MLYLILAMVCSAMISILMQVSAKRVSGNISMLAFNYLACTVIAGIYSGTLFPDVPELAGTLGMGAVNGVLYLAAFVLLQLNVKKNGVVLSSVFMKLGLLVPMAVSMCFFGEIPAPAQMIGFCIAVAAIVLINMGGGRSENRFRAGLIVLLLTGGTCNAMSKIFEESAGAALSSQFLFYTFASALLCCISLTVWKRERPGLAEAVFGLLVGVPNYFSSRFLLLSLSDVPAVIAFPTFSVGTILIVTLAGICLFKERLAKRQWIAVAAILVALALLNV